MPSETPSEGPFATSRRLLNESNAAAARTAQRLSEILDLEWDLERERKAIYGQTIGQAHEAVVATIKVIAGNRGWNHDDHWLLDRALRLLGKAYNNDQLHRLYEQVDRAHRNYFDYPLDGDDIDQTLDAAQQLVGLLEHISRLPLQPCIPTTADEERILERLTRTQ